MTILNLRTTTPMLADLLAAIDGLQAGVRVAVRDTQTGSVYRIEGAAYDTTRMALVLDVDSSKPIVIPPI